MAENVEHTQKTKANKKKQPRKLCMISSSGGHYEELEMLKKLGGSYDLFWVTEKTQYRENADYYLWQTGSKDPWVLLKMMGNAVKTLLFWLKEKPQVVITTGTLVALPACLLAKLSRKKVIFIESFSRIYDGTRMGKLMYRAADAFIYQWETLADLYPDGIYGGSIF